MDNKKDLELLMVENGPCIIEKKPTWDSPYIEVGKPIQGVFGEFIGVGIHLWFWKTYCTSSCCYGSLYSNKTASWRYWWNRVQDISRNTSTWEEKRFPRGYDWEKCREEEHPNCSWWPICSSFHGGHHPTLVILEEVSMLVKRNS